MERREKCQAAVEYMMTYGWAILAVLVFTAAIWQMGVFTERPTPPGHSGFTQLEPLDFSLMENGTLTVVVQNNAGTIVNLRQEGTSAYVTVGGSGECTGLESEPPFGEAFRPAATSRITFSRCDLEGGARIGSTFRVNLTISFYNPSSNLLHKSNGLIWGPLG